MSRVISQELDATGVAQVIVVLKEAPAADIGARATAFGADGRGAARRASSATFGTRN